MMMMMMMMMMMINGRATHRGRKEIIVGSVWDRDEPGLWVELRNSLALPVWDNVVAVPVKHEDGDAELGHPDFVVEAVFQQPGRSQ
jgi:hypothetical protein